ncbi:MAG: LytTR family DNA-binding domain-containing protein [Eubacteriales bacterium]
MKIRNVKIVPCDDADEEIIIRCREVTEEVKELKKRLEEEAAGDEISLWLHEREYFIKKSDILFFETADGKTAAHTKDHMYYTDLRLCELSASLPRYFMRVSKSCVLNTRAVSSLRRDLTGIGEAAFAGTEKKVYISRMYYKPFRELLHEERQL